MNRINSNNASIIDMTGLLNKELNDSNILEKR